MKVFTLFILFQILSQTSVNCTGLWQSYTFLGLELLFVLFVYMCVPTRLWVCVEFSVV